MFDLRMQTTTNGDFQNREIKELHFLVYPVDNPDLVELCMFDLRVQTNTNGDFQNRKIKELHSLVCPVDNLCMTALLAVEFSSNLLLIDAITTYQNTMLSQEQMLLAHPPLS